MPNARKRGTHLHLNVTFLIFIIWTRKSFLFKFRIWKMKSAGRSRASGGVRLMAAERAFYYFVTEHESVRAIAIRGNTGIIISDNNIISSIYLLISSIFCRQKIFKIINKNTIYIFKIYILLIDITQPLNTSLLKYRPSRTWFLAANQEKLV